MVIGFADSDALSVLDTPEVSAASGPGGRLWRLDPPEVEGTVITTGGLWPSQNEFWQLPSFIKVLVGGYGCGKTFTGAKRCIALAMQNAPVPIAAVSPTFPMARQTTIATIEELLVAKRAMLGRGFRWWVRRSPQYEYTIRYRGRKGRIVVYSGDNPVALKGPNLAGAWIDEPFIQAYEVFKQMVARVRHPSASNLEIFLTGTPEQLNWGYDLCIGELEDKHDVRHVVMSTRENKALDPSYVSRLEGSFAGRESRAYIEGEFVQLGAGQVFHAFGTYNVIKGAVQLPKKYTDAECYTLAIPNRDGGMDDVKIPSMADLGAGMDFNVDPMATVLFWHHNDHIHFFDEIELPNSDTEEMCDEIKARTAGRLKVVYPDPSGKQRHTNAPAGKTDFTYIQQAGFSIEAPSDNYARRDSFNAVNGKLKNRRGEVTCTVSSRCKRLIKYLSTHTHELAHKREQRQMTHLLDAFRYPITRLYPISRGGASISKIKGV